MQGQSTGQDRPATMRQLNSAISDLRAQMRDDDRRRAQRKIVLHVLFLVLGTGLGILLTTCALPAWVAFTTTSLPAPIAIEAVDRIFRL